MSSAEKLITSVTSATSKRNRLFYVAFKFTHSKVHNPSNSNKLLFPVRSSIYSQRRERPISQPNNAALTLLNNPTNTTSKYISALPLTYFLASLCSNVFNTINASPTCARADANAGSFERDEGPLVREGHVRRVQYRETERKGVCHLFEES